MIFIDWLIKIITNIKIYPRNNKFYNSNENSNFKLYIGDHKTLKYRLNIFEIIFIHRIILINIYIQIYAIRIMLEFLSKISLDDFSTRITKLQNSRQFYLSIA